MHTTPRGHVEHTVAVLAGPGGAQPPFAQGVHAERVPLVVVAAYPEKQPEDKENVHTETDPSQWMTESLLQRPRSD